MLVLHARTLVPLALTSLAAASAAQGTIGNFPDVAFPPGNPSSPEKIQLGKALFFDEQLSGDNTMACATCHLPEAGGADIRAGMREAGDDGVMFTADDNFGSPGVVTQGPGGDYVLHPEFGTGPQPTSRNTPTVIGAAFFKRLFWDQSAGPKFTDEEGNTALAYHAALEAQAVGPPTNSVEMAHAGIEWDEITEKIATAKPLRLASALPPALADFVGDSETYGELFTEAFGDSEVTRERIAMAIATYERTLVPDQTPFDLGTMTPQQLNGLNVFEARGCGDCHSVDNGFFSNGDLETIHLPDHERTVKTPSLRNVGLRPRYMHSGQYADLDEVLDHYQKIFFLYPPISPQQRADLEDFLVNGLTDPRVANLEPPFDRPILHSEKLDTSTSFFGQGLAGSGDLVPTTLVLTPPNLSNPDFRIGLRDAMGGSQAILAISANPAPSGLFAQSVPLLIDYGAAAFASTWSSGSGAGNGIATVHVPLPDSPVLDGADFYSQWLVIDPGAPEGMAASMGTRIVLFAGGS